MNPDLFALAHQIRKSIIEESYRAGVGHIGSALCIADILAVLFGETMSLDGGQDRDRLILSKGHAALGLYAALAATGRLSKTDLESFCSEGTPLGAHPEHVVPAVDFSTGSLGHGLSIGAGAALAARLQRSERRTFVLLSDAELNEGSVWEAAMFAAHQRLGKLVAILDLNGQQALGYTHDVLNLDPVAERWRNFGWAVDEIDGHDLVELADTLESPTSSDGRPHMVIARTTFGKGVSYMESRIEWHYLPMAQEQFGQAIAELDAAIAARGEGVLR
jgi:transketolase